MTSQPAQRRRAKNRRWLRIAWFILSLHALSYASYCYQYYDWLWIRVVATYLLLVAVVGCWRNWGPSVLLSLAGFYFGALYYRAYDYCHDYWESMMQNIGFPVIFAIAGALIGIAFEIAAVHLPKD